MRAIAAGRGAGEVAARAGLPAAVLVHSRPDFGTDAHFDPVCSGPQIRVFPPYVRVPKANRIKIFFAKRFFFFRALEARAQPRRNLRNKDARVTAREQALAPWLSIFAG
jgi:hypothetical protein